MLRGPKKHERATIIGRYAIYDVIASGGMATVHYGRLLGPVGFSRTVAVKRLHAQYAKDPEFVAMFIDEARLAARIRHPNVVQTLDVVATGGELFLVMDYVQGESLSRLMRASRTAGSTPAPIPVQVASAIICGALHGLHAAHEAIDERGEPLGIVHRDMSPQNVLVDLDGIAKVLDFGVAKAAGRAQTTGQGQIKGKIRYMAPEQINGQATRQTDVFASSVVLWEVLTGERLFTGDDSRQVLGKISTGKIDPPSLHARHLPPGIDAIVMRGLERDPEKRYATAREMAMDLESCLGLASPTQVGAWVESLAQSALAERAAAVAEIESSSSRVVDHVNLTATAAESATRLLSRATAGGTSDRPSSPFSGSAPRFDSIPVTFQPEGRPARPVLWRLGIAALLAGVSFALVMGLRRPHPAPSVALSAPVGTPVAGSGPAARDTPASSAPSQTVPAAAAPIQTVASAIASAGASGSNASDTPPAVKPTHHSSSSRPASAPATPALDCDPPYSLDDQGHKHWKDACFRK